MTSNSTPTTWRRITATIIGAGAIAVGVMAASAPAANAEPQKTETQTGNSGLLTINPSTKTIGIGEMRGLGAGSRSGL
jgi:hypothetical protein